MKSLSGTRILNRNLVNRGGVFATPQDLGFQLPLAEILLMEGGVIRDTLESEILDHFEPKIEKIAQNT